MNTKDIGERVTSPSLPAIRRVVNYYEFTDTSQGDRMLVARPAIITGTQAEDPGIEDKMSVHLFVMSPTNYWNRQNTLFSEEPKQDHWSWPKF